MGTPDRALRLDLARGSVRRGQGLVLRLRARSTPARALVLGAGRDEDPWESVGLRERIELDDEWRWLQIPFLASRDAERARVYADCGGPSAVVALRDVRLDELPWLTRWGPCEPSRPPARIDLLGRANWHPGLEGGAGSAASLGVEVHADPGASGPARLALTTGPLPAALHELRLRLRGSRPGPVDGSVWIAGEAVHRASFPVDGRWTEVARYVALPEAARGAALELDLGREPRVVEIDDLEIRTLAWWPPGERIARDRPHLQVPRGAAAELSSLPDGDAGFRITIVDAPVGEGCVRAILPCGSVDRGRYLLRYEIRATSPQTARIALARHAEPWDGLGLYEMIRIGADWTRLAHPFVVPGPSETSAIHLELEGHEGEVDLRDIELETRSVTDVLRSATDDGPGVLPPAGPELGWSLQSRGGFAAFASVRDRGFRLRIEPGAPSGGEDVEVSLGPWRIEGGRRYALRIRGRSSSERAVTVGVALAHPPWTGVGLHRTLPFGPDPVTRVEVFEATTTDDACRIVVRPGALDGWLEIEEAVLVELPRVGPGSEGPHPWSRWVADVDSGRVEVRVREGGFSVIGSADPAAGASVLHVSRWGWPLDEGARHRVALRARAEPATRLTLGLRSVPGSSTDLGFEEVFDLDPDWLGVEEILVPAATEPYAVLALRCDPAPRILDVEEVHVAPVARWPRRSLLICTTPRSGSGLLAHHLWTTGKCGRPQEYFLYWSVPGPNRGQLPEEARRRLRLPAAAYLQTVLDEGTTPNGVFGAKLMQENLATTIDRLREALGGDGREDPEILDAALPGLRYVHLTRRDKVRQAVSYVKARRTGIWFEGGGDGDAKGPGPVHPVSYRPPVAEGGLRYDFDELRSRYRWLVGEDASWRDFFDRHRIEPLVLEFERVVREPAITTRTVFEHLGVPMPPRPTGEDPPPRRQADHVDDEWEQRFREDWRRAGEEPLPALDPEEAPGPAGARS